MNNELKKESKLSNKDFLIYYEKMKNGDMTARNKIIEGNMRLVYYIVYKKLSSNDYDKEELVSIGFLGLIKAVDTFDLSKNIQFSTYASRCIYNEILMYFRKHNKSVIKLSLDETMMCSNNDGGELSFIDTIADNTVDIENDYVNKDIMRYYEKYIDELPEIQSQVIKLYFGFDGDAMNQADIAHTLGVSRPYVSRLIKSGIERLRLILNDGLCSDTKTDKAETAKFSEKENIKDMIISLFYGLNGYETLSAKEIALKLNVTIGYVHNIIYRYRKRNNITKSKRIKTIYEFLKDYDKTDIDNVISTLSDKEKELINSRYGNDLNNPVYNLELNKAYSYKFYNLISKIRRILEKKKSCLDVSTISSDENNSEVVTVDAECDRKSSSFDESKTIDKSNLDLLKNFSFKDLLGLLPVRDAMIVGLRYGCADNKIYTIDEISNFFGISKVEVIEICKKSLIIYKNKLNGAISEIIDSEMKLIL